MPATANRVLPLTTAKEVKAAHAQRKAHVAALAAERQAKGLPPIVQVAPMPEYATIELIDADGKQCRRPCEHVLRMDPCVIPGIDADMCGHPDCMISFTYVKPKEREGKGKLKSRR